MLKRNYVVDSVEALEAELAKVRSAQAEFALFTQEQVNGIFLAAASAANKSRIPLAKMAVEETGMGVAGGQGHQKSLRRGIYLQQI